MLFTFLPFVCKHATGKGTPCHPPLTATTTPDNNNNNNNNNLIFLPRKLASEYDQMRVTITVLNTINNKNVKCKIYLKISICKFLM